MKRFLILLPVIFLIFSCAREEKKAGADSAAACIDPVNPNGDSELAVLMRQMTAWTDSARLAIQRQNNIPAKPADFNRIITAEKTDKNIGEEPYGGMARHYLTQVENFDAATDENRVELFNSMVRACVGCHENFCGGPVKRINRLFIPEAERLR
ncbi:MAG TPA: hypothetical protein VI731_00150 [Bacteroidia bacterium]|nr:hypothetical protein [Bacteroidia bacterium]